MIEIDTKATYDERDEKPVTQKFVGIAPAPAPAETGDELDGDMDSAAAGEAIAADDTGGGVFGAVEGTDVEPGSEVTLGTSDNDILYGNGAMFGGSGDDIIVSLGGNVLIGGDGNDILDAASGDVLRGGDGADIFLLTLGDGSIKVRDFDASQGDIVAILNVPSDLARDGSSLVSGGRVLVEFASAEAAALAIGEIV